MQFAGHDVGAVFWAAANPGAGLVFGHGAGAGMMHPTLINICSAFASVGLSSLRFNFPYMEAGKSRVDSRVVTGDAFEAALALAESLQAGPWHLGGHSFGGRMASHAVAERSLEVEGLIFCSFPLHIPGKANLDRAAHLDAIPCPMLFLSGTRDAMADVVLMSELVERLGARIHWLDTGDHGYKVLKRSRTRPDTIFEEMAEQVALFIA